MIVLRKAETHEVRLGCNSCDKKWCTYVLEIGKSNSTMLMRLCNSCAINLEDTVRSRA